MSNNRLTELACKKANTAGKKLTDGDGMYLLIHTNGSKYWRMDYRMNGKRKTLALGGWPETSLTQARELRDNARRLIKDKIDPVKHKRDTQQSDNQSNTRTFSVLFEEWFKRQQPRWSEKHALNVRRSLEYHVHPDLGDTPIAKIVRQGVLSVLRKLEDQGKNESTHRIRQRIESVFNFAIITGDCDSNPAAGLTEVLTPPTRKTMAALKPEELPAFLRKLEGYQGHMLTKLAWHFMLYTFVRTAELRMAQWSEFDLGNSNPIWIIPPERMKMRSEHQIHLSPQAVNVLGLIAEISGEFGLVFPSQNNPNKPMSENTLLYALYRMGYHSRATTHGFRSVASTILNESGKWHPDAIERQLAHVDRNKVRAVYNRSQYIEERRRMMCWWADHLDSLLTPAEETFLEESKT